MVRRRTALEEEPLEPIEVVGRRRLEHPEPERLRHRRGGTVVHRVRAADVDPARAAVRVEAGTQLDEPGVARRLRTLQTPRQREIREWICVHKKRAAIFRPPPPPSLAACVAELPAGESREQLPASP